MASYTLIGGEMDEEEAAAALAALACVLEEEAAAAAGAARSARGIDWHDTAKLVAQGLIPRRLPVLPRWNTIERLRRAGRGGTGIVGQ